MESHLAFERDPLFGNLSEPLIKIETRRTQVKQRFWVWKEPDFFWFWNEDEPDFFGVFFDATDQGLSGRSWFAGAARTTDSKHLKEILHSQFHYGEWGRAITVGDPRPHKDGLWRILWKRREFVLQNAFTGRAVRFFPESNWNKDAQQWHQLNCFSHDAAFFADMFWPLLKERKGRLKTALEFLELPIEDQEAPVQFGKGGREEFLSVMGAALTLICEKHASAKEMNFTMRFHHRSFAPLFNCSEGVHSSYINGIIHGGRINGVLHRKADIPELERLATSFEPHLLSGFSLQNILPSPLRLFASGNEHSLRVSVEGPFSAHEQIEAIATVREWVTQNAPELLRDWS